MKSFLTSFKSTEPKKTTWRQDWSLDQPFQNLTCYYTTQLPLFHRHPTQSIISQSISESLSALQGYTVWVDCNLVQIIQLQMPPYMRLNSKHLYKIWSEREAVLMCKNVLKWMVSNFISPMLRLLPSFEGRGGGVVHMLHSNMSVAKINYMHDFNTIMNFKHFSCAAWRASWKGQPWRNKVTHYLLSSKAASQKLICGNVHTTGNLILLMSSTDVKT